jgi:hypothetical protein
MNKLAMFLFTVLAIALAAPAARAAILFEANLNGLNERPAPNASPAVGHATGALAGGPGSYVFTYSLTYSGLTTASVSGAHIHLVSPGIDPVNEFGGVVHPLDGSPFTWPAGVISGDWRFDDAANKLTDARATDLLAGKMYMNVHTTPSFAGGEIRGQLVVVPEPASLGLLAMTALAGLRRRRI